MSASPDAAELKFGPTNSDRNGAEPKFGHTNDGLIGPVRIFTPAECRLIAAHLARSPHPPPADWNKGRAVTDPFIYRLATRPVLLAQVTGLLGENVVLWGAAAVSRRPGQSHAWHTDIESASPAGGFVSVWIGLENTSRESSLQLIARSHTFGATIQQVAQENGCRRGEASAAAVLGWAQARDPDAALVQPDIQDGDGLLFDGRVWHGSHNSRAEGDRTALLLQYARADVPVRIPDFTRVEWPFRFLDTPRPPVILVHGTDGSGVNRLVPPPESGTGPAESTWIHPLRLPLAQDSSKGWKAHHIFRGPTPLVDGMECHVSVLGPGHSPHPPHIHPEEEILIVLDGDGEIVLADGPDGSNARIERLRRGSFAYYPSGQHHTIRNASPSPVTYLMFKWLAGASRASARLGTSIVHSADVRTPDASRAFRTTPLVEGATGYLELLHAHLSIVQPSGGYDPHMDAHDVALIVLEGKVETLGQVVEPHAVAYCAAGSIHGLRNVGDTAARYLVFEFHAPARDRRSGPRLLRRGRWAAQKGARKVIRLLRRVRTWGSPSGLR